MATLSRPLLARLLLARPLLVRLLLARPMLASLPLLLMSRLWLARTTFVTPVSVARVMLPLPLVHRAAIPFRSPIDFTAELYMSGKARPQSKTARSALVPHPDAPTKADARPRQRLKPK